MVIIYLLAYSQIEDNGHEEIANYDAVDSSHSESIEELVNAILGHDYDSDGESVFEIEFLNPETGATTRDWWEPRSAFYDEDGTVTEEFVDYCKAKGLSTKLSKKKRKS
jgi:hypothetical protein